MGKSTREGTIWYAAGALVLLSATGMTLLSRHFVYGVGHAERPIPSLLGLYLIGWLGFVAATLMAVRWSSGRVGYIAAVGLAARAVLLPSDLIQESDCYRYVLDGEAVLHGVNPFAHAPGEVEDGAPAHFREALASEDAQRILSRVSYKHIPTIYPPLAQAAFAVGAWLTPWDWLGQRIVFVALDAATILVLATVLRKLGRPLCLVVVYAWNPLVLKEIANSAHLDSLAGFCVALTVLALIGLEDTRQVNLGGTLAGLALGGAILAKLYPVLLLPACAIYIALRLKHPSAAFWFCAAALGVVVLSYIPFMDVGLARVTEGLRIYGEDWRRNDGAFSVVRVTLKTLSNWLGDPTGPVRILVNPRMICSGAVALLALGTAWRQRRANEPAAGLVQALQWTLLCWFLFLPAAFPWYAVALAVVSALRPKPWFVVLSGAFGLYYLLFMYEYRDYPSSWKPWTQAVEHGLVWGALAIPWLAQRLRMPRPSTPECS